MVLKKLTTICTVFISLFLVVGIVSALDVDITSPINGSYSDSKVTKIDVNVSGINLTNCWWNDGSNDRSFDCGDPTISSNVSSNEDWNTWTVYANDSSGTIKNDSVNFWVDSIEPNLDYFTPWGQNYFTNNDSFEFQFKLDESNKKNYHGPTFTPFYLEVRDPYSANFESPDLINLSSNDETLSEIKIVNLPDGNKYEGAYTWIVFAKDKYPDDTIIREVNITGTIIRDVTKPNVWFNSPENNSNHSGTILVNVGASDLPYGPKNITLTLSNSTMSVIVESCSYNTTCISNGDTTTIADGQYILTATAYDKAGNVNSTNITINVDNTAPKIFFNSPANGSYNSSQLINVTAQDPNLVKIDLYVDGSIVNTSSSSQVSYVLNEGDHSVYARAYDSFGNDNTSETRNIIVDLTPPEVNITQEIVLTNSKILLNSISYDSLSGISSYLWEKISGPGNLTFNSPNSASTNVTADADGVYEIKLTVTDNVANEGYDNLTFIWDTISPTITLKGADPQIINVSDSYTELGATANDNYDGNLTSNITIDDSNVNTGILGNYSVIYSVSDSAGNLAQINRTVQVIDLESPVITLLGDNPQTIEVGDQYTELGATANDNYDGNLTSNITIDNSSVDVNNVGTYNVTYSVSDSSGNPSSEIRTVNVIDTLGPIISMIGPGNNTPFDISDTILLNYNLTDYSGIDNCSLILNNILNQTNNSINKNNDQSFTFINLNSGEYIWKISCFDDYGNSADSNERSFTVLPNINFSGNSTNLSEEEDISNVSYFYVENKYGIINFTTPIDFSKGFDWTQYINLSFNHAGVDSAGEPELGKPAVITLFNLSWDNPRVLRDGSVCSNCNELSYVNGTFVFDVPGFSTYTTEETPDEKGGGGGGGSSSSSNDCSENCWICTKWSQCTPEEKMERVCTPTDEYDKIYEEKPIESVNCTYYSETSGEESGLGVAESKEIEEQKENKKEVPGITGAILGNRNVQIGAAILFIILVIAGYLLISNYAKKK